jgi:NADPH2:quinone reductase
MAVTIPATMRALQQTSLNGPQDTRLLTDAPVPSPGPGELLIRVDAAGVNFADLSKAHGTFLGGPQPPYLAGFEAAGEVVAAGEAVNGLRPGARVVGVGAGAFAEYMILPAAAALPVPDGWSAEQALGLVVNWPTALAALRPLGRVAAGETVLIQAAAGATGQAAVTLAKHFGATVVAAASPGKHATVRALGADHVLDSRAEDLAARVMELTAGAGADLVLESAGGSAFHTGLAAARRVTGRVVVYGVAGGEAAITNRELVYGHQVQIVGFNLGMLIQAAPRLFGALMGELSALIAAGVLAPTRPTTYALADGATALAELASRATVGKLALLP